MKMRLHRKHSEVNPAQPNLPHPLDRGGGVCAVLSVRNAPPRNLDAFIREIAVGIGQVYGPAAAQAYRDRAERGFGATLATPGAALFTLSTPDRNAIALLIAVRRDEGVDFPLVHVLAPYAGGRLEHYLVAAAARHYRDAGVAFILSETIPNAPMALDAAFGEAGFTATPRGLFQITTASLSASIAAAQGVAAGAPIRPSDFGGVATCISAAYADHPGRWLHPEVRQADDARMLLLRLLAGAYGPVLPNYCRVQRVGNNVQGALLGCEVAPGVGFVVQLVVAPEARGQGIATRLLGEFAEACHAAGVEKIALGVTLDNPARKLYERLGFSLLRPITAYTWWRG